MGVRRLTVVGALLLAGLSGCATGPGAASPTPTPAPAQAPTPPAPLPSAPVSPPTQAQVDGVWTTIEFDPRSELALEERQIEIKTEEPTRGQLPGWKDGSDTVHLPISDGQVVLTSTPPRGRVHTEGHLAMDRQGTSVEFEDLDVDLDSGHATGTVDGRRITVLDLDLSRAHVEALPSLPPMIVDISGRMTEDARREIHDHLSADLSADDTAVDIELRLRPAGE